MCSLVTIDLRKQFSLCTQIHSSYSLPHVYSLEITTLHCLQTELVPLDTEHWYMPESPSNRPYMVMLDPLISTREPGDTSSPFLHHLLPRPAPLALQVKETLVPTELSKLSPGLEVTTRLVLAGQRNKEGLAKHTQYVITHLGQLVWLCRTHYH